MKAIRGWALLGVSLAAVGLGACGGDDDNPGGAAGADGGSDVKSDRADTSTPMPDVRPDTGNADNRDGTTTDTNTMPDARDGGTEGGGGGDAGDSGALVARGEYLVKNVGACGDCHTPVNLLTGQRDETRFLAGMPGIFQVPGLGPDGGVGIIGTPNLTPDMTTGLGAWTDAQIKKAFLDGIDKDGNALFPIMPYYVLHNMLAADADAIVAYLRTIPAIMNSIPEKNFAFPAAAVAPPVPADMIPNPTLAQTDPNYASAMRGKYLAGNIGVCMECHTKHVNTPGAVPLDLTKLFGGGEGFDAAAIGLPPQFPVRTIFTENITPHATGIQGWTAAAVRTAVKDGIEKNGLPICPPMPSGAGRPFNGITDGDALDIGNYIINLPPINNVVAPICHDVINSDGGVPPDGGDAAPPTDGATSDTGADTAPPTDAPVDTATPDAPADTGGGNPDVTNDTTPGNDGATDGSTGDGSTSDSITSSDAADDGASDATPD